MDQFFSYSTMMLDGNKTSLKNSSSNYIKGAFLSNLLWYSSLQASVNRVKTLGACFFKVLLKHQNSTIPLFALFPLFPLFLSSTRTGSRSNFPYNIYFEVLFIGLANAKAALHYLDSNFYRKIIIHYYSLLSFPLFLLLFTITPFIHYDSVQNSYEQEYIHIFFWKSYSQYLCKKSFFTSKFGLKPFVKQINEHVKLLSENTKLFMT